MRTIRLNLFVTIVLVLLLSAGNVISEQQRLSGKQNKTICLNMIVKNESHVITRCLDSVLPMIDTWVIVDTGSTDGTQDIIRNYMKQKNIKGELHERPWVNFGYNREEILQLAKGKADYILFMDADDVLHFEDTFTLPSLKADNYLIASNCGGMEYFIPRLIKSNLNWHWHGVLHEYVSADDAVSRETLNDVEYTYICDGARAKDPEKYLKDAKILLDALEKDPNNSRYMFYLAQTYGSAGDLQNAIKHYQKRVEMGGWPEEVFWSLLQIGHFQEKLKIDSKIVEESYVRALKFRPSRPEPFFYLVNRARLNEEYAKGYKLAKVAIDLPRSNDTLFLEKWTYDALLFEFSLCAYYVGEYEQSLKACDALLANKNLSEEYKEHTLINREFALNKVQEKSLIKTVESLFIGS